MLGFRIWLLRARLLSLGYFFLFLYGYGPKGAFSRKENLGLQAEREIKWGGTARERERERERARGRPVMWPADAAGPLVSRQ